MKARADALMLDASRPSQKPPDSVDELVARLLGATSPGEDLLMVGTSSVAAALRQTDADSRICFIGPDDVVSAEVAHLSAAARRYSTAFPSLAARVNESPQTYFRRHKAAVPLSPLFEMLSNGPDLRSIASAVMASAFVTRWRSRPLNSAMARLRSSFLPA